MMRSLGRSSKLSEEIVETILIFGRGGDILTAEAHGFRVRK